MKKIRPTKKPVRYYQQFLTSLDWIQRPLKPLFKQPGPRITIQDNWYFLYRFANDVGPGIIPDLDL